MLNQNYIILGISILVSFILLLALAAYITGPLTRVSVAMQRIIKNNDLSQQVVVEYRDEIGHLANTFNIMIAELERAYQQIKEFAFKAVLAQRSERKIRSIFQKYVPKDVIDSVFRQSGRDACRSEQDFIYSIFRYQELYHNIRRIFPRPARSRFEQIF